MCAVSMVTDYWKKNDQWKYGDIYPGINTGQPVTTGGLTYNPPTRAEFEQLRKEMMELKELLKSAKAYDEATNQPKCEKEENVKVLKKVAEALGVELNDIFE